MGQRIAGIAAMVRQAKPWTVIALAGAVALAGCSARPPAESVPSDPVAVQAPAQDTAPANPQVLPDRPEASPAVVMVEVQGAVNNPGVYTFPSGARLLNALGEAGGVTTHADTSDLNIAARLIDGSVLTVPYRGTPDRPAPAAAALNTPGYTRSGWDGGRVVVSGSVAGGAQPISDTLVNLNTATQFELEALPGVGPKTAVKILRFRELQPFGSVDDLRLIPGIGEKRVETLRPLVTVD